MSKKLKAWDTYHTRGIRKKFLYRYGEAWKAESFLKSKGLYLSKMSRFDDKLEGISTYDITELRTSYEICFIDEEKDINPKYLSKWQTLKSESKEKLITIGNTINDTQNSHFVSCWFNSDRESDGMWRFYADKDSFCIKLNRKDFQHKIKASVSNNIIDSKQVIVAGRVNYQDFPRVIEREKESQVIYLAFRKDMSFSHESEYRIVMIDLTNEAKKLEHRMYNINDFDNLEISIIAHPKISDYNFEKHKELFESYGSNVKVIRSELEPFYKLPDRLKELKS